MNTDDKCPHGIELTAECLDCNETAHAKNYAQLGMRPETRGLALQVLGLLARLKAEREESKRWEASSQEHAQLKEEREEELARYKASSEAVLDEHRRNWCIEVTALHKERDELTRERDEARAKNRDNVAAMKGLIGEHDAAIREHDEALAESASRFDCHGGPGTTEPACNACVSCLLRNEETLRSQLAAKDAEIERLNLERSQVLEAQRLGLQAKERQMLLPPEGLAVLLGIDSKEAWDNGCPRLAFRSYMIAAGAYGLYVERGGTPIENDCANPERFHGTGGGR